MPFDNFESRKREERVARALESTAVSLERIAGGVGEGSAGGHAELLKILGRIEGRLNALEGQQAKIDELESTLATMEAEAAQFAESLKQSNDALEAARKEHGS